MVRLSTLRGCCNMKRVGFETPEPSDMSDGRGKSAGKDTPIGKGNGDGLGIGGNYGEKIELYEVKSDSI